MIGTKGDMKSYLGKARTALYALVPAAIISAVPTMARMMPPIEPHLRNYPAIYEQYKGPKPVLAIDLEQIINGPSERRYASFKPTFKRQETPSRLERDREGDPLELVISDAELKKLVTGRIQAIIDSKGMPRDLFTEAGQYFSEITRYDDLINEAAGRHGLDPMLVYALMATESEGQMNAFSDKGAAGLMQLMPGTARALGLRVTGTIDQRLDPKLSIDAGVGYLKSVLDQHGDIVLALKGYNMGPTALRRMVRNSGSEWSGLAGSLPKETRDYVIKVLSRYALLKDAKYGLEIEQKPLYTGGMSDHYKYMVQKGDTMHGLARTFNTSVSNIQNLNPSIKDVNKVAAGSYILVPKS